MSKVPYPAGIRTAAARFGCDLPTHANLSRFGFDIGTKGSIKLDSKGLTTSGSVNAGPSADAVANATAPSTAPSTTPSAPSRAPFDIASRAVVNQFSAVPQKKAAVVKTRPVALALPLTFDPNVSLAIADKLVGDPNVKNGKEVVKNTIAIAQLPRENANEHVQAIQRGAAVIDAITQIREATGAAPGQAAIPVSASMAPAVASGSTASAYTLTDGDIAALDALLPPEHESIWLRLLHWLETL